MRENELRFKDEYFEDEVRCGFMVPGIMKQAWAAELEVLHEIDVLCRKHNLTYYADWGTLLAAVRHGGFIPWDDDLDIAMPRKDYIRFMELAKTELPYGMEAYNYQTRDDHWLFLARVISKPRICFEPDHLEKFHQFPYIVSVDIFVLDKVSDDDAANEKRNQDVLYTIAAADRIGDGGLTETVREQILQKVEAISGQQVCRGMVDIETKRRLYGIAETMFARFEEEDCGRITQLFPFGLKDVKNAWPREYYEHTIRIPFENTTIPVPVYYDRMLRKKYGNYMRLIRQWDGHDYPYFEEQIPKLKAVLDFDLPEYSFHREQLREYQKGIQGGVDSFKSLAQDCVKGLQELFVASTTAYKQGSVDAYGTYLREGQQLAIDLGTMIEQVKGEGHPVVAILEEYCEALYQASLDNGAGSTHDTMKCILDRIQETVRDNIINKKEIVFIPNKPSQWKYMQDIWEEKANDTNYDVYVVPVPYYYKKYDGTFTKMVYEAQGYPEQLQLINYQSFDLSLHHPECIVFSDPYDQWHATTSIHPDYYSEKLQNCCDELVYVQPFEVDDFDKGDYNAYHNLGYYATVPGVVRADVIVVPTKQMRQMYIEKLKDFCGEDSKQYWENVIQVSTPQVTEKQQAFSEKKKILYYVNPGFLVENGEQGIKKIKETLETFISCGDKVRCSFCEGAMLRETTEKISPDILSRYEHMLEEIWDETIGEAVVDSPVEAMVLQNDAFYGDGGAIALGFAQANKPVLIQEV